VVVFLLTESTGAHLLADGWKEEKGIGYVFRWGYGQGQRFNASSSNDCMGV